LQSANAYCTETFDFSVFYNLGIWKKLAIRGEIYPRSAWQN